VFLLWLVSGRLGRSGVRANSREEAERAAPDPMAEIEKVKAEFEQRLADGEAAAKAREEAIRKEQAAAIEAARDEADKRMARIARAPGRSPAPAKGARRGGCARGCARAQHAARVKAGMAGVSLYSYVQADYQVRQSSEDQLDPSNGQPLNQDRFSSGAPGGRDHGSAIRGRSAGDRRQYSERTPAPAVDVEASAKWPDGAKAPHPWVMGTIGLFRIPFGARCHKTTAAPSSWSGARQPGHCFQARPIWASGWVVGGTSSGTSWP